MKVKNLNKNKTPLICYLHKNKAVLEYWKIYYF